MASDLEIVNIVGTGKLPTDVNYTQVMDEVDLSVVQYDPSIHQGLELRFIEEGPLITVYNTGKYIIRANSFEALYETRDDFLDLMAEIGVIDEPEDDEFNINNVVCTGNLHRELSLEDLSPDLSQGVAEFDPETFPGIQYKPHSSRASILIFRSGKIVVTGAESFEMAKEAYQSLINEVDEMMEKA